MYVLFSPILILILLNVVFIFYIDDKESISQGKTVVEWSTKTLCSHSGELKMYSLYHQWK